MNCFCGMVDRWKAFRLISSRDRCQRSSPSRISDTPRAGFEPVQDLSSGLLEWSRAVMITTTPRRQIWRLTFLLFLLVLKPVLPLYRKWISSSIKHPLSFLVQLQYFKFATVGWGFLSIGGLGRLNASIGISLYASRIQFVWRTNYLGLNIIWILLHAAYCPANVFGGHFLSFGYQSYSL